MISGPDKSALSRLCLSVSLCQLMHIKSHTNLVVLWSIGGAFHSFIQLLKVLLQPLWHHLRRHRQSERQTKNGDRGFAVLWAFNLSKWHQGLRPSRLIILKLNLGRRMTQTCVFIKESFGFNSFVFMRHTLLCSRLCCTLIQPLLLVGAYFISVKDRYLKSDLQSCCVFDL